MLQIVTVRSVVMTALVALILLAPIGATTCSGQECKPRSGSATASWQPWGQPDPENWGDYGIKGSGEWGCENYANVVECLDHIDTMVYVCNVGGLDQIGCKSFKKSTFGVTGSVACQDVDEVQAEVNDCMANHGLLAFAPGTLRGSGVLDAVSKRAGTSKSGSVHQGDVVFYARIQCGCASDWVAAGSLTIDHVPEIVDADLVPRQCTSGGTAITAYDFSFDYRFPQATSKNVTLEWVLEDESLVPVSISCSLEFEGTCPADGPTMLTPPARARAIRITAMACGEEDNKDIFEAPLVAEEDVDLTCKDITKDGVPAGGLAPGQPDQCASDGEVASPIRLTNGNMTYYEADALPSPVSMLTERVYDSMNDEIGVFGLGWFSVFDSAAAHLTGDLYEVRIEDNRYLYFESSDGVSFVQVWPGGRSRWTLEGIGQLLRLTTPLGTQERTYDLQQGGHLVAYRDVQTGDEVTITYDGSGYPTGVTSGTASTDPWSWTITTVGGLIDEITTPAGIGDYSYSGSFLDSVSIGSQSWRAYIYGTSSQKLEEVRDGASVPIEKHEYYSETHADFPGWALTSETAGEAVTNVEYQVPDGELLPGRLPDHDIGEYVTRVTWISGLYSDYYIRPIPGRPHQVVQIEGKCPCGAAGDFKLNAFDTLGRLVRSQDASGAITEWTYDSTNRVTSLWRGALPSGCDPATDPDQCRLDDPEALLAATLDYSDALQTSYQYGDSSWPSKATQVCTPSVLQASSDACTTFTFDATNGKVLTGTESGWVWDHATDTAVQEQRVTTRTLYSTDEDAAFNPATEAGSMGVTLTYAAGWATWATLAQPVGLPKQIDGPLLSGPPDNAADVTVLVHYPIDSSVPGPLQGRLAASKNPLGEITFYDGYDQFGNATRVIDSRGVVAEYQYDGLGRQSAAILKGQPGCDTALDPLCAQDLATTYQYDGASRRVALVTAPGVGNRQAYEYDSTWGRREVVKQGPPTGDYLERILYEYPVDDLTSMPIPGPWEEERYQAYDNGQWVDTRQTQREYDASDRLSANLYPDGGIEEYTYGRAGRLIGFADGIHDEPNVLYEYDQRGRLVSVKQLHDPSIDYPYATTVYAYDRNSNLISVTDANGNVTTYRVDDFGQTYEIISGVTGTTELTYDRAGRLAQRVDARGVIEQRQYDDVGKPEVISYSNGGSQSQSVTYGYTAGRRTAATTVDLDGHSVVEAWAYDRRGLLLRHQRDLPDLSRSGTISYGYDAEGHELWHSSRCTKVAQDLDYAGRPVEIRVEPADVGCTGSTYSVAEDIEHLPFGPAESMTRGPIQETLGFDQRYRMTSQVVTSTSGSLFDRTYSYDQSSNLLGVTDNLVPSRSVTYGYDDMSRLRSATRQPSTIKSWEYDLIGNRRYYEEVKDGVVQQLSEYDYADSGASPKLVEVRTAELGEPDVTQTIGYDAIGNVIGDDISGYTYDLRNRLKVHSDASWAQDYVSYRYDSSGWRVYSKSEQTGDESVDAYLLQDAQPFVEVTLDGSLVEVREMANVFLGDDLLARVGQNAVDHVISSQASFPFAVVDDLGLIVWDAEADPFGTVTTPAGGTADHDPLRRYPGQWVASCGLGSASTILFFNTFRWYASWLGRYTQADPVGHISLEPGPGFTLEPLYSYAIGNPLAFVDPTGLSVSIDDPRVVRRYNKLKECSPFFRVLASNYESARRDYPIMEPVWVPKSCNVGGLRRVPSNTVWIPGDLDCKSMMTCLAHELYEYWLTAAGGFRQHGAAGPAHDRAKRLVDRLPLEQCCSCKS